MSDVLDLARELISRSSVTPDDAGCQELIARRLAQLGFEIQWYNHGQTTNLWACKKGDGPLFCFLGHTDVVPAGPEGDWRSPPFEPTIRDGKLYGRGAADMKGSVAAMVVALEQVFADGASLPGSVALLLTSDEEGRGDDGIRRIVPQLANDGVRIDYCLVGEPTCAEHLGDTLRVGRRGSLSCTATVFGKQGHVAYPAQADNAAHRMATVMAALGRECWDEGDDAFPATGFQVVWVEAGVGAHGKRSDNVIPGLAQFEFNFRYNPISPAASLQARVQEIFNAHAPEAFELAWRHSAEPFVTADGTLRTTARDVISQITGITPLPSTGGGASDGRFVAPTGAQVVEFGPLNTTIHAANEWVAVDDLGQLSTIYREILRQVVCP